MNRLSVFSLALAGSMLASPAFAQEKSRPREDAPRAKNTDGAAGLRGKIIRVQGENQFVVRSADNKEVTFYASPETRYTINGKAGRFGDLRVGTEINANYSQVGERYNVTTVTVGAVDTPPVTREVTSDPPAKVVAEGTIIRGRIVKMQAPDQFVVRTATDKEVIFYTTPQTRYTVDGRVVQFRDLRVGAEVNAEYTLRENRHLVSAVTVGQAVAVEPGVKTVPAEETRVEGTVVRIGEGVVVVKTGQNKEITINVDPKTRYVLGEEPARISDFRTGSDVRIEYDVRDRRPVARIINGVRRNNK